MKLTTFILVLCAFAQCAFAATITNNPGQLNTGNPGDTIIFAGNQTMTGQQLPGDRTYKFEHLSGGNATTPTVVYRSANNVTIAPGSVFDNANVAFEKCSKPVVRGVTFNALRGRTGNNSHVIYCNVPTDGDFSNNNFIDQQGAGVDTCIFAYDPIRTKANGNHFFPKVHEAIHFMWYGNYWDDNNASIAYPTDVEVKQNEIVGIERHGIELQGAPNGLDVMLNHISGRTGSAVKQSSGGYIGNGIGISCATGGHFDNGSYKFTNRIRVNQNVIDNTGWSMPGGYSQCMGIELMGRAEARDNIIVQGGQGIAITFNPPNTPVTGNKFKNQNGNEIVADSPPTLYVPIANASALNDFKYTGAVPTYAQLIGTPATQPATQPAPLPSTFTLIAPSTTATTVQFSLAGLPAGTVNVRVKSISSVGREVGPTYTLPASNVAGPYNTGWLYDFTAEALNVAGNVIGTSNTLLSVQVKAVPPPAPPPPSFDLVLSGTVNGQPVIVTLKRQADGSYSQPTTKPSN